MKKGRVRVPDPVGWHPKFGRLKHGQIIDLPDDWNFKVETLCDPVEDPQAAMAAKKSDKSE